MSVVVTRPVRRDEEHNTSGEAWEEGDVLYEFHGATWGCVDTDGGVALSAFPGQGPFFEFPADAVTGTA
jgi:hypothetical protein